MLSAIFTSRPTDKRSDPEEKTYDFLDSYEIPFLRIDHDAANTIAECKEIEKHLGADICKNLFLKNSAKTQYYLLLMSSDKKFASSDISKKIGSTRLSFADEQDMQKMLCVTPGSVSVLSLIFDVNNEVELLIDSDLFNSEYFCCHPCKNTSTLKFKASDIFNKFLPLTGHKFKVINI